MRGLKEKTEFSFVKGIHCVLKKTELCISNQTLSNFNPIFAAGLVYGLEQVASIASLKHLEQEASVVY